MGEPCFSVGLHRSSDGTGEAHKIGRIVCHVRKDGGIGEARVCHSEKHAVHPGRRDLPDAGGTESGARK